MTNFKDLSIVIPTYNRPDYIKRSIDFWSSYGVQLIIFDGSNVGLSEDYLGQVKSNIKYFHQPIPFLERLKNAINLVETEYVSMIPDDEFFLPSTILKCMEELENGSITSCGGQSLGFSKEKNEIKFDLIYPKLRNYNFLEESGTERMARHMKDYTPMTLYSIMKSDIWKKSMALMTKRIVDVYSLMEIEFEMSATFHGKTKTLPEVFWLRSKENKPTRNEPGLYTQKVFSKWWPDRLKIEEHKLIINDLLENFETDTRYTRDELTIAIHVTFDNIVEFQKGFEGGISHKLARRYPKLIAKLNEVRNLIISKEKKFSLTELYNLNEDKNIIFPKVDLTKLHDLIHNFHFR